MSSQSVVPDAVELLAGRLFWVSTDAAPRKVSEKTHFFSTDRDLVYEPFASDFGPLNLGLVYRYATTLRAMLDDPRFSGHTLVHYCSRDFNKRANAAFLAASFLVVDIGLSASEAWSRFGALYPPLTPFRDASAGPCSFQLSVLDCLAGLEKAMSLGWFSLKSFDLKEYEFYEKLENGDLNWIVPKKFAAFAGPSSASVDLEGYPASVPEDYISYFKLSGIANVVRLNKPLYEAKRFQDHGIRVHELYFLDGSCPSRQIIEKFLSLAEESTGPLAIHCKAGLGRTGTLIGLYCMKHFAFPARAFIGWNRICRPGAILGPQQQFLCDMESTMFKAGEPANFKFRNIAPSKISLNVQKRPDETSNPGDEGQGERLNKAKHQRTSVASDTSTNASYSNSLFGRLLWNGD